MTTGSNCPMPAKATSVDVEILQSVNDGIRQSAFESITIVVVYFSHCAYDVHQNTRDVYAVKCLGIIKHPIERYCK